MRRVALKRAFPGHIDTETTTAILREEPPDLMGENSDEGDFIKYLCLVYGEEKDLGAMTDDECMAYDQTLRNDGKCLASEALQPARTARVVRVRDGKVSVRDGPFAETKELLAGFYLIDAADLNEAVQFASQIPPARVGTIEVRPVRELTSTTGKRRRL